jgi:hypothetical protein
MAMLYRETVVQAQVLSYADEFWVLLATSIGVVALVPFMRRVRAEPAARKAAEAEAPARDPGLPAPAD